MNYDWYEPKEFTVWWEAQPIPKGTQTEWQMRQIALCGYIEGQRDGFDAGIQYAKEQKEEK